MNLHILLGGAGFIGQHLKTYFNNKNENTIVIDKKAINSEDEINFDFAVYNKEILEEFINYFYKIIGSKIDSDTKIIIHHLACNLGVENVIKNDKYLIEDMLINQNINFFIENLIEKINKNGSKIDHFLYYSTSEVYGDQKLMMPQVNYNIKSIIKDWRRTRYAVSKINNEFLWKEFTEKHKINYKIIRPFNVVGPKQSLNFVIPKMIKSALESNNIIIYGKGDQKRTFTDVRDFVVAIDKIILIGDKEVYNVANIRNNLSIKNLAEMIKNILEINGYVKDPIEIIYKNVDQELIGDKDRIPDVKDLYKLYIPKYSIKDIIYEYLETEYPEKGIVQ